MPIAAAADMVNNTKMCGVDFSAGKRLIGMVHLARLPGGGLGACPMSVTLDRAIADARAIADGGFDAVLVENFHDAPFARGHVPSRTVAAMAVAVAAVRAAVDLPVGVNVLRNDVRAAIAIAAATGASFVRCNVYVGAVVADQGILEGAAREAIEERAMLATDVAIWADVHVKHAAPLAFRSIADEARDAVLRGRADALIVTGPATGDEAAATDLAAVRSAVDGVPLIIGSGLGVRSAASMLAHADGAIVGSALKPGGDPAAPVDPELVRRLAEAARGC
ncbi:MAG TPA: BtpA/SgcQ family protein [Chthonomonadales bacterium]|nr:BtpA/SgcQ family protein [Chthonomonadales bacterium]